MATATTTTTTVVHLLITSTDCNPKSELKFSGNQLLTWNSIIDALTAARYNFAMRRLPPPLQNPKPLHRRTTAAYLSLYASRKAAFFYGGGGGDDDHPSANRYHITYDPSLMDHLPSDRTLKGLPRFHLFESLPEELQCSIAERLDGVGFARMRCVNRRFSRLEWSPNFDILKYSRPVMNGRRADVRAEKLKSDHERDECNGLLRLASAVCFAAVVFFIVSEVRPGVRMRISDHYENEDEDEDEELCY